jgi:hypothetical protein
MKDALKELAAKLNLKSKDIVPVVLAAAVTAVIFLLPPFLNYSLAGVALIADVIGFSILLLVIMIAAGFMVMESLVGVAAGLSLLIFLAQSYCASGRTLGGDSALKSLLGIGLLYISYYFFSSVYDSLIENLKKINKPKGFWKFLIIISYVAIVGLFIWELYQVIGPIISGLCVFK